MLKKAGLIGEKGRWALLFEGHDEKSREKTLLSRKDVFRNRLLVSIVPVKQLTRRAMHV